MAYEKERRCAHVNLHMHTVRIGPLESGAKRLLL
jgi:hypothetical protein